MIAEYPWFTEKLHRRSRPASALLGVSPGRRSGAAMALAVSQGLFIVVTAALFVAWLTIAR